MSDEFICEGKFGEKIEEKKWKKENGRKKFEEKEMEEKNLKKKIWRNKPFALFEKIDSNWAL